MFIYLQSVQQEMSTAIYPLKNVVHAAPFYAGSEMAFCVHRYVISHVTYEDFLPYIEKWYTPKIPHNKS